MGAVVFLENTEYSRESWRAKLVVDNLWSFALSANPRLVAE
jgi:hypothetical protein